MITAPATAQGLVTLTCGTFGNVFRFLPPLAIGDDLLAEGLDIFEAAFEAGGRWHLVAGWGDGRD